MLKSSLRFWFWKSLFCILLGSSLGCSKEKEFNKLNKCNHDFTCDFYDPIISDIAYLYPVFLNNNLEIAVIEEQKVNGILVPRLVTLNLLTREKKEIKSPFISVGKFDSNLDDLIVYSDLNWKVYTLSISTGVVNQISFSERDLSPRFNPAGNRICYAREFDPNGIDSLYGRMVICDPDGQNENLFCRKVEFYCSPWDVAHWGRDSEFVAVLRDNSKSINRISIYDTTGIEKEILHMESQDETIHDVALHPSKDLVYFTKSDGIYEINLDTKSVVRITEKCQNTTYSPISISPSGGHIIGSRKEFTPLGECSYIVEWNLILISTENTDDQRIIKI